MLELPSSLYTLPNRLLPLDAELPGDTDRLREAAVLVLLFPDRDGESSLVLTARPETLSRHAGQISLPGGRVEPADSSLLDTALRETREELGIDTRGLAPLGRLDPVEVTVSGYRIAPFVTWTPTTPAFRPDPAEVARVIEAPVSLLLDPEAIEEEEWEFRGGRWIVTFYRVGELIVWGATARVLSDLAIRLQGAPISSSIPGNVRAVH